MRIEWDHPLVLTLAILVGVALIAGASYLTSPTTAERQRANDVAIAACRALGGEPVLRFDHSWRVFYLHECRLESR